ncbi:hypothetical protein ACFE04_014480 [Oxalis oulophora]
MDEMQVPRWLETLLSTPFFSICPTHKDSARSECNMFCLDCQCDAFCFFCRSSNHNDHNVIQIRRSSYHDVVRAVEIQKELNINGVQTYVINSAKVIFLNERPQQLKSGIPSKGGPHLCETCGRSLLDPLLFCSLGCKVQRMKEGKGLSISLLAEEKEEESREGRKEQEDDDKQSTSRSIPTKNSNSRRRKGIPHRAPFGCYNY